MESQLGLGLVRVYGQVVWQADGVAGRWCGGQTVWQAGGVAGRQCDKQLV